MKKVIILLLMFSSVAIFAQEVSRKNSPNRFIVKPSLGVFSDFAYDHEEYSLNLDNIMYGGMIGYRSDFKKRNYKFSSNGRDKNRSNVTAIFVETGVLGNSLNNLTTSDQLSIIDNDSSSVRFSELQFGFLWREFLRFSGGFGTTKTITDFEEINTENANYHVVTSGINLRFGRFNTELNYSLLSTNSFEDIISRWDVRISMNLFFWQKVLHQDKK